MATKLTQCVVPPNRLASIISWGPSVRYVEATLRRDAVVSWPIVMTCDKASCGHYPLFLS